MAPASRIGVIAGRNTLQATSRSNHICLQCQIRAHRASHKTNPPFGHLPTRRHASFMDTEKWRRKIWGTDTPPGAADPYGGPSVFEQRREMLQLDPLEKKPHDAERRTEAPAGVEEDVEDDVNIDDYKPATTWEKLPRIGGDSWAKNEYISTHPFEGFMYSKLESREEIVMAVHQALVEVFTLKQADLPLSMDANPSTSMPPNEYLRWLAEDASFEQTENGDMQLVLGSKELRDAILDSIMPKEPTEDETGEVEEAMEEQQPAEEELAEASNVQQIHDAGGLEGPPPAIDSQPAQPDMTELNETYDTLPLVESVDAPKTGDDGGPIAPANDSWRNVPLEDQAVKFAVLKRVMQLTGTRIPDPAIGTVTNAKILLSHLVKKPEPKKLADHLVSHDLAELPNVQISKRRHGLIDKEKEVGRWKVITQELERFGLQRVKARRVVGKRIADATHSARFTA